MKKKMKLKIKVKSGKRKRKSGIFLVNMIAQRRSKDWKI